MISKQNKRDGTYIHQGLASQPYYSPCAHARMISGWGDGFSLECKITRDERLLAYLHRIHSGLAVAQS